MNATPPRNTAEPADSTSGPPVDLAAEPDFLLGNLTVRPSSREVVLPGRAEMLEPRVMQVLTALARRRGEVVSRDQLMATCWEGRVVSEDAINRSITKVRRWASPATFTLETIPRVGYRLEAATRQANTPPAAAEQVAANEPRRYSTRKKILLWLAAVAVVIFAFCAWMGFGLWRDTTRPFFAVLPFDATAADPEAVKIADAISTTVNHRLASQGFRVVSPAMSGKYRGADKADAADLDSRFLIDGNVRIDAGRVRVAVRIDATVKPMTVWSREFVVDADDAQRLPERISAALAGLFNPTMQSGPVNPPEVTAGLLRINTLRFQGKDLDAYIAAKQFLREVPGHYTPQIWYATTTAEALDLIPADERAVELANARRNTELADVMVWNSLPTIYFGLAPPVEWAAREAMLRTGLDEPYADGPTVRYLLSTLLVSSGRIAESIDRAKQANVMFSMSARFAAGYANVLDVAGRRKEADDLLERSVQTWPNSEFIERLRFTSALSRGDWDTASTLLDDPTIGPLLDPPAEHRPLASLLRALRTHDATDIASVEYDCADPSKLARDRATWCLYGLVTLGRLDTFFAVAPLYFPEQRGATRAERDAHWMQSPRVWRYARVLFRSDMKAVRADPRFIPIVERLGLIEYWRTSGKWPDFCKTEPESVCSAMRDAN